MLCHTRAALTPSLRYYSSSISKKYDLALSPLEFNIYTLAHKALINLNLCQDNFVSVSICPKEITFITHKIPDTEIERCSPGWRAIYIDSQIPFEVSGVLHSVIHPLLATEVSLLVNSTFSTDYFFFPREHTELVCKTLREAGFKITEPNEPDFHPLSKE